MGNRGFSLVELIIVIVIMAALIAILAPQYIKYVEKSRVSADGTVADEFLKAAKVMVTDEDYAITKTFKITWTNGAVTVTGDDAAEVTKALNVYLDEGWATSAIKSKAHAAADLDTYTVDVTFTDGIPDVAGAWGAGAKSLKQRFFCRGAMLSRQIQYPESKGPVFWRGSPGFGFGNGRREKLRRARGLQKGCREWSC